MRLSCRSLVITLVLALGVYAQLDTGTITGRVTDATGAAVPNVQVSVVQKENNFTFSSVTNGDGIYRVQSLQPGTYTVSFMVASPSGVTDAFHLANSTGTNLSGSVNIPATGGWETWTTVTATVTLPAGQQVLTLNEDNGGFNFYDAVFAE